MNSDKSIKSLTFFYPVRQVGGAQLLFARIAVNMYLLHGYKIEVIDFKDGFINTFLRDRNIPFRFIEYLSAEKIKLSEQTCLIIPDSYFYIAQRTIQPDQNIFFLFWNIHSYGILSYSFFSFLYRRLSLSIACKVIKLLEPFNRRAIAYFIDQGIKHYAYVFMDNKTFLYAKSFFPFKLNPFFLPIPIEMSDEEKSFPARHFKSKTDKIRVAWVSRLELEKVYSLRFLINNIVKYNDLGFKKCVLNIIGDGSAKNTAENWCKESGIDYIMSGTVNNSKLKETLINDADISFAMGTSALESAKLGIPTVMVSGVSFKIGKNDEYPYIWLFESLNYSLGLSEADEINFKSFIEIIKEFERNADYLSRKCHDYCVNNHDMKSVCAKLNMLLSNNSFNKLDRINRISFLSRMKYSIAIGFSTKHKVRT